MRSKLFIILAVLSFWTAACSSTETPQANSNKLDAQTANIQSGATNEIVVTNANTGEKLAIPGINEPLGNAAPKATNVQTPEKMAKPEGLPAPDDSVFTTQLTDVGLETRTFKSHPILKKVERITNSKGKTIKVYLRSGKVVELPGDKLANIRSVPASEILKAVGIVPKEQTSLPPKSEKQEQKVQ